MRCLASDLAVFLTDEVAHFVGWLARPKPILHTCMARRRLALPPLAHRTLVTSSREPPAASHQPPAANRTAWCLARQQVQQQVPMVLRQFPCWAHPGALN
jgi:hypothetical protein